MFKYGDHCFSKNLIFKSPNTYEANELFASVKKKKKIQHSQPKF